MIYKNSLRILFSNFDIVWKTILYYFFNFLLVFGLCYLCINPIYNFFDASGFVSDVVGVYTDFLTNLNLTQFFESINELFFRSVEILTENISKFWLNFLFLFVILFFVQVVISNLTIMSSCNSLHYYMGSMNKHGFYLSYNELFGKNLKTQFVYFLVTLPLKVIYIALFILSLKMFNISFAMSVLAIFIIIIGFVLLISFKFTLFGSWIPTIVVLNYGILKSLKVSVKNSFKNFKRVFPNAIGIAITIILINIILGPFTLMVGLLISIPTSYLIYSIFGMVTVYECQGMRYYVDVYNVITPKKKEIHDNIKSMKFFI